MTCENREAEILSLRADLAEAMEIVSYVVGWEPVPHYGPGPIGIDHDVFIKAKALVERRKVAK